MNTGRTRQAYCSMQLTCSLLFLGIVCLHTTCCNGQVDPLALGRADPQCWETSTVNLLEIQKPRIADSVAGFWDIMIYLKSSDNDNHGKLFWELAQLFWDIYVDCVLSRTHGLGRRQLNEEGKKITNFVSQFISKTFSHNRRSVLPDQKELIQQLIGIQINKRESRLLRSIKRGIKRK
ncbi:protein FAM237A isoform 1-T2 [Anomaloglossus baeobatrachus]|uniref:protein FAM237A n=1 Tax=Anomaloglossus baeobatrachus TaxID=238106 RepID=UPI003F4FBE02